MLFEIILEEKMRIAWFCIPAHGHTNPTLGLVKTLTEAGHQIWYPDRLAGD